MYMNSYLIFVLRNKSFRYVFSKIWKKFNQLETKIAHGFFYGILKIQIIKIKTVTVPNFDHALFELYNNPTA